MDNISIFGIHLTTSDCMNLGLLIVTFVGLVFTGIQLMQTKKLNRASLVKELYYTLYNDPEIRDFFFTKIEWSNYNEFDRIEYHGSKEECQLDKLLSFFDSICNMFYLGVLKKKDMELFSYEMQRVYDHPIVKQYFLHLEHWQDTQKYGESYINYKKYCAQRLLEQRKK